MKNSMRYVHTNIVAQDWRKLAAFYEVVFGCRPVPPERDLKGDWVDHLTGIRGAHIEGIHLRLPGYADNGPTLEIFSYTPERTPERADRDGEEAINARGLRHLAFHVDSVEEVLKNLLNHGGKLLGKIIHHSIQGAGELTVVYCTDPEGNFVELQNWS